MSAPVVRFAPSPTGRIHIGNARPALLNALFARASGGRFVLRFDDTDARAVARRNMPSRSRPTSHWLGVRPDLMVRQSDRVALYDAAVERLQAEGRLYPAYETADELDRRRKRLQARGLPPVYDRAALRSRRSRAPASRPRAAGRTGASGSTPHAWPGTTSCAGPARWTAPR